MTSISILVGGQMKTARVHTRIGPFVIHKPVDSSRHRWHITHIKSAIKVCGLNNVTRARLMARELAALGDWNFSTLEEGKAVPYRQAAWELVKTTV